MNDWQKAQDYFHTDPLKYLVHLKYMHLYGDSITCSFIERDGNSAVLLRYPSGQVIWDAAAYPTAEQVLLPTADNADMAGVLLEHMRQNDLLERSQVIKFCEATTEKVMCEVLKLEFARSLTSYTNPPDARFEADPQVVIERQPHEAHMAAFIENGYSREEVAADFAKGAILFSLYDGDALLSFCMTYQNFDDVWEIAGVHTADSARRKGYGRRVVQTALSQVLREGRIPRYQVEDVNRASVRLAEGLGLQPCLHFKHYVYQPQRKDNLMTDKVLQDQIEYYRARAGEYDEWFYRVGRYDWGVERNAQWFAEVERVFKALRAAGHVRTALELAAGTGNFTKELASIADHVLALDASPEVLAINRDKAKSANVEYRQADLFNWQPDAKYDLVFMSFWMSHVPPEKLDSFLETVKQATKVGGHVFMVDSLRDKTRTSTASNHADYDPESIYHTRKLNDGQEYTIVKMFYDESLVAKLAEHGFTAQYHTSGDYFWWANGIKS